MPAVNVDRLGKSETALLSRLPLEFVWLDWPTGLTASKLSDLLIALPHLKEGGLTISSEMTWLGNETEWPFGGDNNALPGTVLDFRKKNDGLTLEKVKQHCQAMGRSDLLQKLGWKEATNEE